MHTLPRSHRIEEYLRDPFLKHLYAEIARRGPLRSIVMDLTHRCNIRCQGCYFFAEDMDRYKAAEDEAEFDAFIAREKARGTNFVTVAGGEPALVLDRVKKLHDAFPVVVITNGIIPIPYEGFEKMPIGVSVWGDHETDTRLRGSGKLDVFARGLRNYRDDPRVTWYYTTTAGNAHEIESVVEQCVANGNYVMFNFYGDISGLGGDVDHRKGFDRVRDAINRAIDRYPDRIMISSYLAEIVSSGKLYDQTWGYDVCGTLTIDNPINSERLANGNPYSPHFKAFAADLVSTRRCGVGNERDCSTCMDVWAHLSWITLNAERHLGSKQEFTNWLGSVFLIYLAMRTLDFDKCVPLVPEVHARMSYLRR